MMRWLRRMLVLGVLVGAGCAGYQAWTRRRGASAPATPEWPPLRTDTPVVPTPRAATWLAPVDGKCPDGYPLKANDNSGIFHSPGGRFYDRTVAERCYARAADAIADGYRPAKA